MLIHEMDPNNSHHISFSMFCQGIETYILGEWFSSHVHWSILQLLSGIYYYYVTVGCRQNETSLIYCVIHLSHSLIVCFFVVSIQSTTSCQAPVVLASVHCYRALRTAATQRWVDGRECSLGTFKNDYLIQLCTVDVLALRRFALVMYIVVCVHCNCISYCFLLMCPMHNITTPLYHKEMPQSGYDSAFSSEDIYPLDNRFTAYLSDGYHSSAPK